MLLFLCCLSRRYWPFLALRQFQALRYGDATRGSRRGEDAPGKIPLHQQQAGAKKEWNQHFRHHPDSSMGKPFRPTSPTIQPEKSTRISAYCAQCSCTTCRFQSQLRVSHSKIKSPPMGKTPLISLRRTATTFGSSRLNRPKRRTDQVTQSQVEMRRLRANDPQAHGVDTQAVRKLELGSRTAFVAVPRPGAAVKSSFSVTRWTLAFFPTNSS